MSAGLDSRIVSEGAQHLACATLLRTPNAARVRGSARGFTLVELMVVIVLIGILSAMILPNMKGTYGDALLRSTSRDLVNAFSLAYSQAVSLNEVHRVRLDTGTSHYFIEKRVSDGGIQNEFRKVKDISGCEGKLDQRVAVLIRPVSEEPPPGSDPATPAPVEHEQPAPAAVQAVTFYPDGTADGAEVMLRDREGFRLGLRVDAVTARVRIIELGRE